jgi:hypothetical protein
MITEILCTYSMRSFRSHGSAVLSAPKWVAGVADSTIVLSWPDAAPGKLTREFL